MNPKTLLGLCILACLVPAALAVDTMTDTFINLSSINTTINITSDCTVTFSEFNQTDTSLYMSNVTVNHPLRESNTPVTFTLTTRDLRLSCVSLYNLYAEPGVIYGGGAGGSSNQEEEEPETEDKPGTTTFPESTPSFLDRIKSKLPDISLPDWENWDWPQIKKYGLWALGAIALAVLLWLFWGLIVSTMTGLITGIAGIAGGILVFLATPPLGWIIVIIAVLVIVFKYIW